MIEIKFSSNSAENLIRQIQAFVEKIEVKEAPKRGKREKAPAGEDHSDLGRGK